MPFDPASSGRQADVAEVVQAGPEGPGLRTARGEGTDSVGMGEIHVLCVI